MMMVRTFKVYDGGRELDDYKNSPPRIYEFGDSKEIDSGYKSIISSFKDRLKPLLDSCDLEFLLNLE